VQLNYLQRGEGEPVVLLHGLFGSAANLGIVARGLAPEYCVYSLDVRNHGESPHSPTMSYRELAADVVEFMDSRGISCCRLLGHSMGGKIAMQVAMDYPQRVQKLIVADVAPVSYPPHHQDTLAALAAVEAATITSRAQADELMAQTVSEASVRSFLLKSLVRSESGEFHWRLNRQGIADNYAALGSATEGNPYNGPVLFIKGGESDYILPKHEAHIRRLFPAVQLKIIAGTGHWLHAEKPALFNPLVQRFFHH
jgi:esterase